MLTHHVTLVFMLNMLLMQVCKCLKFESPNNIEFYVELKRPVSGFKAAKKSCEAVESRLVVADSNETIHLLASKLLKADDKKFYIGLQRNENGFVWLNGKALDESSIHWSRNSPGGSNSSQNCVVINKKKVSGKIEFDDISCQTNNIFYICEKVAKSASSLFLLLFIVPILGILGYIVLVQRNINSRWSTVLRNERRDKFSFIRAAEPQSSNSLFKKYRIWLLDSFSPNDKTEETPSSHSLIESDNQRKVTFDEKNLTKTKFKRPLQEY